MLKFLEHFKNRNFSSFWLAQIISQFGDRINQMALIGLVAGRMPGSAVGLAKILSFTIIPVFIVGPIAGVYVDRWDRRTTLFVCDFLRCLLVLSIPFALMSFDSMIPIYVVVFFIFCFSRFYVPAKMSIIPDLVKEDDLLMANSLVTVTGMIAFVMGCALGGFIVEKLGARGGFIWDAATFFISGLLVFSISKDLRIHLQKDELLHAGKELIDDIKKSVIAEIKDGIKYLVNHRDIRFVINLLFVLFSAAGAVYTVVIVFIQDAFGSITKDLGVLAVFLGAGLFVGTIVYGRWGKKISKFMTIFLCLILGGLMLVLFAWLVDKIPSLSMASFLSFSLGVILGPIFIAVNTIIHLVSDDQMRGKVFSSLDVVIHSAFLVAMFVSSYLAEFVAQSWILIGAGALFAGVGFFGLITYKKRMPLKEKSVLV